MLGYQPCYVLDTVSREQNREQLAVFKLDIPYSQEINQSGHLWWSAFSGSNKAMNAVSCSEHCTS